MDIESSKNIKSAKDIEEHRSLRFWASMFWSAPLIICSGLFYLLGPIIGGLISIALISLCIPFTTRKIMYFLFSIFFIVIGLIGGLGGIIVSILCCVFYAIICGANYAYVKQTKEIENYERHLEVSK